MMRKKLFNKKEEFVTASDYFGKTDWKYAYLIISINYLLKIRIKYYLVFLI